jgi:hypothetical protein
MPNDVIIAKNQLQQCGYDFNEKGELREFRLECLQLTNEKFIYDKFNGDKGQNEASYDALGKAVTNYIYVKLISEMKFKIHLPKHQASHSLVKK